MPSILDASKNGGAEGAAAACFRCRYDLRGIADEQPCPECGLLASRSWQLTLQLRDAKPGYLRRISIAIWIMLAAFALPWSAYAAFKICGGSSTGAWADKPLPILLTFDVFAVGLVGGVWLLMRPEPGSAKRRPLRHLASRLIVLLPLAFTGYAHTLVFAASTARFYFIYRDQVIRPMSIAALACAIAVAPLPIMLWRELRDLARRLLSRQLAEHSTIVGAGMAITLLAFGLASHDGDFFAWCVGETSIFPTKNAWMISILVMSTGALLFWLWALYLLLRFAMAFWSESRERALMWRKADASIAAASPSRIAAHE